MTAPEHDRVLNLHGCQQDPKTNLPMHLRLDHAAGIQEVIVVSGEDGAERKPVQQFVTLRHLIAGPRLELVGEFGGQVTGPVLNHPGGIEVLSCREHLLCLALRRGVILEMLVNHLFE